MALPFRSIFALSEPETGPSGSDSGVHRIDGTSLHAAIPEDLRSSTVWSAGTVELELEGAEVDEVTGEISTRLEIVYRACPQFFARPVDETSDRPVRLRAPGGSVGGDGGSGNPFAASNPFASPLVSPIGLASSSVASPFQAVPGANPFASAVKDSAPKDEEVARSPLSPLSPFLAAITGSPQPMAASGSEESVPERMGPPPLPAASASEVVAGGGDAETMLVFPLKVVLSGVDASKLGIQPAALPEGWKTRVPLSLVKPQLASGQVLVSVGRLLEGADAAARTGLQGLPVDLEIALPLKDVYRQLPVSGEGEVPVVAGGSSSPFMEQAKEEATRGFVPLKEAPPVRLDPTLPAAAVPATNPFAAAAPAPSGGGEFLNLGKVAKPAPVVPDVAAPVESLDDLGPEPVVRMEPEAPVESRPEPEKVSAVVPETKVLAAAPVEAPAPVKSVESTGDRSWVRFDGVGFQPALRDLELRAVFGRSEPFTRQLAMDLTAGLPGVKGCVLFAADTLMVLASALPGDGEVRSLAERTPKMFGRINGLAEDLGFESGETFTLRTSQGIVSFFRGGPCCLSVLHQDAPLEGGAWERLVLVARGAAALDS